MARTTIVGYALLCMIAVMPSVANELTLAVDEPSLLGGSIYLATQTVHRVDATHTLRFDGPAEGLPPHVGIDALLLNEDGSFLFSLDSPATLGGTTFDARDVVRFDAGVYSIHVDGGSLGLPDSANVDALTRDEFGRLVMSVDEPVNLFGSLYLPADLLVLELGDLSLLLAGSAIGLAPEDNVVGLDRDSLGWYLLFEEPTSLGGVTYLPGQVVAWDGIAAALAFDAALPPGNAGAALSYPGSPSDVELLLVGKLAGLLELSWATGCSSEASDYAVYEGTLGLWESHAPVDCTTLGATTSTVAPAAGDRYFLVVAKNGRYEGSFGRASSGAERPQTAGSCLTLQRLGACP